MAVFLFASSAAAQPQAWLPWKAGDRYYTLMGNSQISHQADSAYAYDFQLPVGTPVLAAAPGTVKQVVSDCAEGHPGCNRGYGNTILVCYGDGTCSRYAHLSTVVVALQDVVGQAEVLGLSGRTGKTGGTPDLRYQLEDTSKRGATIQTSFQDAGRPSRGDYPISRNAPAADEDVFSDGAPKNSGQDDLKERIDHLEGFFTLLMVPMTLLVAVLSLGGVIGVVFSIRSQRRESQLHELTVGSEMASQRRTEQSFTAFLEGSQKTLNLVNDTLQLAKQATESERNALERKAAVGLRDVEEKAEDLILRVAKTEDFDLLLDERPNRVELERIAVELSRLETYRQLQEDIELPPYCRFIQGIQEFLNDETRTAIRTLRVSTEAPKPQLQRMALYWSAKLSIALGEYDDARWMLTRAIAESTETRIAKLVYRRLLSEVEFYEFAESHTEASPRDRYTGLASVIKDLARVAPKLASKTKNDDDQHPNHEMRATQANVFMWIAYDAQDLAQPLADRLEAQGISVDDIHKADPAGLSDDELRAWAAWEAEDLYPPSDQLHDEEADVDFALRLGRVESEFALGRAPAELYPGLERHAIDDQRREHREHRHTIELAQIALICEARLLHFSDPGSADSRADRGVRDAMSELTGMIVSSPDHEVTVFSHMQRRNMQMEDFEKEAKQLEKQALARWKWAVAEERTKHQEKNDRGADDGSPSSVAERPDEDVDVT